MRLGILLLAVALAGCFTATVPSTPELIEAPSAQAAEMLTLAQTTQVVPIPAGDGNILLERKGKVHLVPQGSSSAQMILDITDRVDTRGERGLSAAAFHPDFQQNGMVFLAYSDTTNVTRSEGFTEVVRYRADPNDVGTAWERVDVVVRVEWYNWYHNMGDMDFGPDGMLYVSLADGSRDRMNAQDLTHLGGSILRINVDGETGVEVPEDNPFVGDPEARPEIWLYGFRNPWRMDFHPDTGDLFIASSGEATWEYVHLFPADGDASRNHGWPYLEGSEPFDDYPEPPEPVNLPIVQYDRPPSSGRCALVGGTVYEGEAFPDLQGKFVFADHCAGQLMFAQHANGEWHLTEWVKIDGAYPTSIDAGADGEIVVSTLSGTLYTIVPA